ncbi:MAG: LegC family aminotransferase [Lysobacteraceae bacterium]|nr:MAG: LegC family aminotransferase [Xanthomonadaceae bacterium]
MASVIETVDGIAVEQGVLRAVRSVLGPTDAMIPLHEPEFAGNEWTYVKECIDTGWVSSVGSYVDRIERDLAAFTGSAHAIATANGTAALHICTILAGVEPGDEVLMPTLTFVATANAVSYAGAVPHFVDSEERTLGVDADRLEAHLRDAAEVTGDVCVNRRTGATIRALVVMHAFGHPSNLEALAALCARWKLVLIEDAAESLGSFYHGRHTGNVGAVSALSFNGNKVMTTGGGGAILTNDPALARRAKHLTTTARVPHRWNFVHDEIGYNYRLPNLNAALGCAQLEQVPSMIARKRRLADRYAAAFAGVPGVRFLAEPEGSHSNYWLNTIVLDSAQASQHEAVLAALNDANYMSRPVWTLMHRLPMYAHCPRADLSGAESLASRVVNIPSSPKLAD